MGIIRPYTNRKTHHEHRRFMIVALAAIAKASPIFYTYPTYGTTVVRSDRLGGNFAYSINQGPAAIAQAFPGHVEIKAAPAYGFQFGYPSLYSWSFRVPVGSAVFQP